ncbi:MAG: AAA family ATPase [Alphaproteobacteria bacterium]|nr:AAA family ATPase [Alphaproteobacteria bacterium]MBF0391860.1 AAA family ATPase [Alphaproteobacteria bacterium]
MLDETTLETTNPLGTLRSLHAKRFTVFGDETFQFSDGLNVLVGENGTGKTHLLKLAYASTKILYPEKAGRPVGDDELPIALTKKLLNVFLPDGIGRLRRHVGPGKPGTAKVRLTFANGGRSTKQLAFEIAANAEKAAITKAPTDRPASPIGGPVYLPTREVVSLVPDIVSDYERTSIQFEETYYDLAKLLIARPLRGPRKAGIDTLLRPLEQAMGGRLEADPRGRLYLNFDGGGKIEAPLVSEGYRKLATLAYLIQNGSLALHGSLFWDEPEANLNPRLMGPLADTLVQLAADGVQIFIATHSLFMMREIQLRLDRSKADGPAIPVRYFSLLRKDGGIVVEAADDVDDLSMIAVLEAALAQDDAMEHRYWESRA